MKTGQQYNGYPVLGGMEVISNCSARFVPDNSWPHSLNIPYDRLVSLIDPSTFVSRSAQIGVGTVIYPNSYVGLNARIGDYVFCLSGCIINHDAVINDRVIMASSVSLAGSVHVESDCYLGQACTCRQFTRIGAGSLIGMGSVIVRDVPQNSVMIGNPARKLRDNKT